MKRNNNEVLPDATKNMIDASSAGGEQAPEQEPDVINSSSHALPQLKQSKSSEISVSLLDHDVNARTTVEILENRKSVCEGGQGVVQKEEVPTFSNLLLTNRPFRFYLSSYIITTAGEWFTYVASIELIEQLLGSDRATSRRYVSLLIVCRLLPNFFLIPFGGILADSRDRRRSMIILDLIGAIAPILFLVASYFKSFGMVYAITLLQASVASFYEPCRSSILPLMVKEDEHMRMATTLTGMAWSVMTSVGAGLGGLVVAQYGMTSCFMLDSVSFIISAILILMIGGEWDVSGEDKDEEQTVWKQIEEMSVNGLKYIFNSKFWPLVFLKMTTSAVYGGGDILNVSFAEEDPNSTEAEQVQRLGALFFSVGFGCMIGPLILEPFTNMENPLTILNACVLAFGLQAIGWIAEGYFQSFTLTLISTTVRAMGSSISWIDSQVLLQMVVKSDMLGRVVAIDYGLALAAEALSSMVAGLLQDKCHISPRAVSMMMGGLAIAFFILWLCYRVCFSDALFTTSNSNEVCKSPEKDVEKIGNECCRDRIATEQTALLVGP